VAAKDDPDAPFEGLDYPEGMRARPKQVGCLAETIAKLTGVSGVAALVAATMWDQGRVTEACEYIQALLDARAAEEERKREDARARRAGS